MIVNTLEVVMQKAKKLLKPILTSIFLLVLSIHVSILEAAPKTNGTLDAIWENQNLKTQSQQQLQQLHQQHEQRRRQSHNQAINDKHFLQNAKSAIADSTNDTQSTQQSTQKQRSPVEKSTRANQPRTQTKYTRAQYQARYKNEQELKLDRQRAAWRAKWEAEQKTKQKHLNKQVPLNNNKVAINKPAPQIKKTHTKNSPKQLTRAQYQLRFKEAQLKKQQHIAQLKKNNEKKAQHKNTASTSWQSPVATSQQSHPKKQSQPTFRSRNLPASYNTLPFEIKNKLRAARLSEYGMSAYVQDVNSPKPLLAHKETISRVPASVMKLITSYVALGVLGPNYRWPLDVYTKGTVQNSTLKGDLIIKGYGSPEFNTEELSKVLQGIRAKGIRNIKGRVVFDNSHFSIPKQHAGAFDGKTFASYNAQPDALLYNERLSKFHVRAKGKRVSVTTSTPAHNLKIVNRMRKTRRGCRPRIGISHRGSQVVATFSGNFSSRCGTRRYDRVISKPAEMIYGSMKAMWKRDVGGTFNARFAMGHVPANAKLLHKTFSRTLTQILPAIDKDSNNVMARQLLLTIGAKHFGGQGTPRKGANAASAWLNTRGLHFPELRIENGSGLSRHARISARHLGDLLVDAYKSPYRNVLMQSLAIAGVDGTMKRRFRRSPVRGRGFFKTGTLRDVRSIAGYVKASNGKTYVISIMHNDPKAKHRGLSVHNKLIEWVYNGGRSNNHVAMHN